jgi:hypothetical protein
MTTLSDQKTCMLCEQPIDPLVDKTQIWIQEDTSINKLLPGYEIHLECIRKPHNSKVLSNEEVSIMPLEDLTKPIETEKLIVFPIQHHTNPNQPIRFLVQYY